MSYVFDINQHSFEYVVSKLIEQGLVENTHSEFMVFSGKATGISVSLYKSGKLVVQGKRSSELVEFVLEPMLQDFGATYKKQLSPNYGISRIGSDESGKGDIIGPLCISAVFINDSIEKDLPKNIQDSKQLSDASIVKLSKIIKSTCIHKVLTINPSKYNILYEKIKNLNSLLAWGHYTVINALIEDIDDQQIEKIIIDKFATKDLISHKLKVSKSTEIIQIPKAESDLAVACASILAREKLLSWIHQTSQNLGFKLAKGASSNAIESLCTLKEQVGYDKLGDFVKLHFRSVQILTDT